LTPKGRYFHCDKILDSAFYDIEWKPPRNKVFTIFSTSSNAFFKGAITLSKAHKILSERGNDFQLRIAGVDKESDVGRSITKICQNTVRSEKPKY